MCWLERIAEADILPATRVADLLREADELVATLTASVRTVKSRTGR
jgi:hypothetical protein